MSRSRWMIYGANGYTGRLIAREAVAGGMRPVLAGRNAAEIEKLAAELACPCRVFRLRKVEHIAEQLMGLSAVLNCAGPFSATARPMMEACLQAGTHYLDITGEIDVIEQAAARSDRAKQAGVGLIPAVGFDVVPSDCLAAMLADRLPEATRLQLAFAGPSQVSPGTAKTILESIGKGGCVRIDGRLTKVPLAWKTMSVSLAAGPQQAMTVPWGDVASAWYTTGIPNIEVYATMPAVSVNLLRKVRWAAPLLGSWPIRTLLRRMIERRIQGPTDQQRRNSRAVFWGRVSDEKGNSAEATLRTLGGYPLTVATALACTQRVLADSVPAGFATPAQAFGRDFILTLPETELRWED